MKEISQTELQTLSGASQRDIENWRARLPLSTKYKKTVQGRPRMFSFDNALEITLLAKLVRTGFTPSAAAERVAALFRDWKLGNGKRDDWAVVFWPDDEMKIEPAFSLDFTPGPDFFAGMAESDIVCTVINVKVITARIEKYFNEMAETEDA